MTEQSKCRLCRFPWDGNHMPATWSEAVTPNEEGRDDRYFCQGCLLKILKAIDDGREEGEVLKALAEVGRTSIWSAFPSFEDFPQRLGLGLEKTIMGLKKTIRSKQVVEASFGIKLPDLPPIDR